jgi:hypothetical protein
MLEATRGKRIMRRERKRGERKPQKEKAETLQLALRSVKGRCGLANTVE